MQVVAYGISINLVEVTWKSKIKLQYPNPNDYSLFMGNFSTATGAVTFAMMLLSRVIFRKFGWGVAALITPTVILVTGAHRPHRQLAPEGFHLAVPYLNLDLVILWHTYAVDTQSTNAARRPLSPAQFGDCVHERHVLSARHALQIEWPANKYPSFEFKRHPERTHQCSFREVDLGTIDC